MKKSAICRRENLSGIGFTAFANGSLLRTGSSEPFSFQITFTKNLYFVKQLAHFHSKPLKQFQELLI